MSDKFKPILVPESLHTRLKEKAAREGRFLSSMAARKLEELFEEPSQPSEPANQNPEPAGT